MSKAKGTNRDKLATQWSSIENSLERIGQNLVIIRELEISQKSVIIRNQKQEVIDYIFNKTDTNPLESISKEINNKYDIINDSILSIIKRIK
jgi:hypothetical protein